jgi:heat shock protein HslJ
MPPRASHRFDRLTVTEKVCPDDEVMRVEKEFLTSLVAVTEIREEEDTTVTLIGEGVTIKLSRR